MAPITQTVAPGRPTGQSLVKAMARALGLICALPTLTRLRIASRFLGHNRSFVAASENLSRIPGLRGIFTRQAFYQRTLAGLGIDTYIGFGTLLSKTQAVIGDRVYIGRNCIIGRAIIEPDVMIADGVQLLSGRHHHGSSTDGPLLRNNAHQYQEIVIGRGAWIGANAVVMADVGRNAIVAAGAVVTKPVSDFAKVAGVPAKEIKTREQLAA